MLHEFDLIHFLNQYNPLSSPGVALGMGDDAALMEIPPKHQLVSSVDTSIRGVHFPTETQPADIGYKSLAVSLSDMAAMGAEPFAVLLTLTLPEINESWLKEFAEGFFSLAREFNLPLVGGDTTRGPLSISTFVQGIVPKTQALLRSGAKANDLIYVSGYLGDAGLALQEWQAKKAVSPLLMQALNRPVPRVKLGVALREIASSAIDISDGLAQDLGHIMQSSQLGAEINLENLPLSPRLLDSCSKREAQQLALQAGDDYELCFTVQPNLKYKITELSQEFNLPLTQIGQVSSKRGLRLYQQGKLVQNFDLNGYQHF